MHSSAALGVLCHYSLHTYHNIFDFKSLHLENVLSLSPLLLAVWKICSPEWSSVFKHKHSSQMFWDALPQHIYLCIFMILFGCVVFSMWGKSLIPFLHLNSTDLLSVLKWRLAATQMKVHSLVHLMQYLKLWIHEQLLCGLVWCDVAQKQ